MSKTETYDGIEVVAVDEDIKSTCFGCFFDGVDSEACNTCCGQSENGNRNVIFKLARPTTPRIPQLIAQALYEELRNLSEMSNEEFRARVDSGFIDKLLDGVKGLG